jgi:hypothetical protein
MSTNYENDDWVIKFITFDGKDEKYIAWDETQANEISRFYSKLEAKKAVLKYAKTLNKKEHNMDFKVGDKVFDVTRGAGTVIETAKEGEFSVEVYLDTHVYETYTEKGYWMESDIIPSLYHKGTEINITPAEPKRYPWVNIYFNEKKGADIGIPYPTEQIAKDRISDYHTGFYVDTIQLKPKGK